MVKIGSVIATVALVIGGCAVQPPSPAFTPIEVKVPIATPVYCQVAKPAKPELPITALRPDSAPADTIRAYAATVAILKGAVRERDEELAGCAPPESQSHSSASPVSGETTPSRGN